MGYINYTSYTGQLPSLQSSAVLERLGHDERERLRYKSEPLDHGKPADLCQDWCYLRQRGGPHTRRILKVYGYLDLL